MFIFYSKGKKKSINSKGKKTNQPTTNHPKMTAADVWASASVLCFLRKCKINLKQAFSHKRNDYMTIPKKPQVP